MFDWLKTDKSIEPRKGMPSPRLDQAEFKKDGQTAADLHRERQAFWQLHFMLWPMG